jgi:leucyl/phenylalanyl-tRNA---protein transferase
MSGVNNPLHFIGQGDWKVPNPEDVANDDGLIALSWELTPAMYQRLYPVGIFPWFDQDEVVFWFSPPVRSITYTREVKVAKSMRPYFNKKEWKVTVNQAFEQVVSHCGEMPRPGQNGTWITEKFEHNFIEMHRMGFAHSFEVWEGTNLIGGTFGVMTGDIFVGESMFHTKTNASKFAYISMCRLLAENGVEIVDNQIPTMHLSSLGAVEEDRAVYLEILKYAHANSVVKSPLFPQP